MYFDEVLRQIPDHPAVLMNQAVGHILGGDDAGSMAVLERSLAACNHYLPVIRLIQPEGDTEDASHEQPNS